MLKVHSFVNESNGPSLKHFKKMMPRLSKQYNLEMMVTSKPRAEKVTDEYLALYLPVAPAFMVGDEIVVEGSDRSDDNLKVTMQPPWCPKARKEGPALDFQSYERMVKTVPSLLPACDGSLSYLTHVR